MAVVLGIIGLTILTGSLLVFFAFCYDYMKYKEGRWEGVAVGCMIVIPLYFVFASMCIDIML